MSERYPHLGETCQQCDAGDLIEVVNLGLLEEEGKLIDLDEVRYTCGHIMQIGRIPQGDDYIDHMIKTKRWFEGIILSCVYFENYAIRILRKMAENNSNEISADKFYQTRLEDLITFLFCSGAIDEPTYTRMKQVKEERNKLVHRYIKPRYLLRDENGKRTLKKAKKALKELIEIEKNL